MPMTIAPGIDGTYVMTLRGLLRKSELDAAQQQLLAAAGPAGAIRLLVVLDGFEGWDPGGEWNDLTFYVRHGDRIVRVAIVGPERWRSDAVLFAAAGLRKGSVEFFAEGAIADGRRWLAA